MVDLIAQLNTVENMLGGTEDVLTSAQAVNGHFPWINEEDSSGNLSCTEVGFSVTGIFILH